MHCYRNIRFRGKTKKLLILYLMSFCAKLRLYGFRVIHTKPIYVEKAISRMVYHEKSKALDMAKEAARLSLLENEGKIPHPIQNLSMYESVFQVESLAKNHALLETQLTASKKDRFKKDIHEYNMSKTISCLLKSVLLASKRNKRLAFPKHAMDYLKALIKILRHDRKMHLTRVYNAIGKIMIRQRYSTRKAFITQILLERGIYAPQIFRAGIADKLLQAYVSDMKKCISLYAKKMKTLTKTPAPTRIADMFKDIMQLLHLYGDYQLPFSMRTLKSLISIKRMCLPIPDPLIQESLGSIHLN
jgi:hypothetical protein